MASGPSPAVRVVLAGSTCVTAVLPRSLWEIRSAHRFRRIATAVEDLYSRRNHDQSAAGRLFLRARAPLPGSFLVRRNQLCTPSRFGSCFVRLHQSEETKSAASSA